MVSLSMYFYCTPHRLPIIRQVHDDGDVML
jgi:hypothetical protein